MYVLLHNIGRLFGKTRSFILQFVHLQPKKASTSHRNLWAGMYVLQIPVLESTQDGKSSHMRNVPFSTVQGTGSMTCLSSCLPVACGMASVSRPLHGRRHDTVVVIYGSPYCRDDLRYIICSWSHWHYVEGYDFKFECNKAPRWMMSLILISILWQWNCFVSLKTSSWTNTGNAGNSKHPDTQTLNFVS